MVLFYNNNKSHYSKTQKLVKLTPNSPKLISIQLFLQMQASYQQVSVQIPRIHIVSFIWYFLYKKIGKMLLLRLYK